MHKKLKRYASAAADAGSGTKRRKISPEEEDEKEEEKAGKPGEKKEPHPSSSSKTELAKQLAPLVDRLGRALADLGPHFAAEAYGELIPETDLMRIPRVPPESEKGATGVMPPPNEINALTRVADRSRGGIQEIIFQRVHPPATPAAAEERNEEREDGNVHRETGPQLQPEARQEEHK